MLTGRGAKPESDTADASVAGVVAERANWFMAPWRVDPAGHADGPDAEAP